MRHELPQSSGFHRPLVLLVEPDGETRTLMRFALENEYDVMTAGTEAEAVATIATHRDEIGVVLMSVSESEDQPRLARLVHQEEFRRHVSVIGTGHPSPADRERAREAGCDDYLPKPFFSRELRSLVADYANV
jgi:two-component system, cell cycle response regulator DivK